MKICVVFNQVPPQKKTKTNNQKNNPKKNLEHCLPIYLLQLLFVSEGLSKVMFQLCHLAGSLCHLHLQMCKEKNLSIHISIIF